MLSVVPKREPSVRRIVLARLVAVSICCCLITQLATQSCQTKLLLLESESTQTQRPLIVPQEPNEQPKPTSGQSKKTETPLPVSVPVQETTTGKTTEKRYNFTVAICTVIKDGEAHLQEWVDFHLEAMEFQNIYLYDNSKHFDLEPWYNRTRNHPIYSRVHVIHYPKEGYYQSHINKECVEHFGKDPKGPQHDYFFFIDDDEYAVIQNGEYSEIRGVLQDYLVPYGGALAVNWMIFGTANRSMYAPVPVTKRFQYRDRLAHGVIKIFVKTADFVSMINPHAAIFTNNATTTHTTKYPGAEFVPASETRASGEPVANVLLLHHYRYTSYKEYLAKKCVRGNPRYDWCTEDGKIRLDLPGHYLPRPGTVFDDQAWQFLVQKVPRYSFYNDWEDFS